MPSQLKMRTRSTLLEALRPAVRCVAMTARFAPVPHSSAATASARKCPSPATNTASAAISEPSVVSATAMRIGRW